MPPADPPRVIVDAVAEALCLAFYTSAWAGTSEFRRGICIDMAMAALRRQRTLPDADRWRLIAWLAEGVEPTDEMRLAGICADVDALVSDVFRAMLDAAAREGGANPSAPPIPPATP